MLKISNIPDWRDCVPFYYFLLPLHEAITKVRNDLLKMDEQGHLFVKYIIEDNEGLKKDVIEMVKKDVIA